MPLCIVYRCCVSERIPDSYLYQVRKKYLDFDTRAQRKEYLLSCKDPRSRLLYIAFCLFSLFMWAQFRVGTCVSFQNNVCTWFQEWFFFGRWSFPYLLERSFFSFGLLNGSNELLCPRGACKNSSNYCAAWCSRHLHAPNCLCYRSATSQ